VRRYLWGLASMSGDDEESATAATKREGPASDRASPSAPTEKLSRGTLVGRYVILDVLGEGGMGVVYGAYDPELDRKVAIKLLQTQPGGSSGGDKAWLVREAQALAKLSHPNVVAVHDVGTLPGDRVFIAMEMVDGVTLRAYLRDKPPWRDALAVLRAAGNGLAAAHAAGLVHRDFKPENVIVGKDGRVRVMDFGLARFQLDDDGETPRPARDSDLELLSKSPLSERLTVAGAVIGTPAYMAPEIQNGHAADPRTDQFAFGVALYEALFRARPYAKQDLVPPISAAKPKVPPDTGVPAAIVRVVMRAISIKNEDRFPSMDALLAELAVDPGRRRRRVALAATAVVAVGGIAGGAYALHPSRGTPCGGIDQRLAGVWDESTKEAVRKAYAATKSPYVAASFAGLVKALDHYTGAWTAAVTDSCKATRVRGEQSEAVLQLRADCFDRRLEEVRALTHLLVDADATLVAQGDKIVWELEPLDDCSNVPVLEAPGQPPPAIKAQVAEISKQLAAAEANMIAGKYLPAMVTSQKVLDAARALGWDPLLADALVLRGTAYLATADTDDAVKTSEEAAWAALRAKRDDLVAHAAITVAMVMAAGEAKPDVAAFWVDLARASVARIGTTPVLQIRLDGAAGLLASASGDLNAAVKFHEKALAEGKAAFGDDNGAMTSLETDLGTSLSRAGAYGTAIPHFEHAIALREASVGPDHPDVALILGNLALCYGHMGQHDKARAAFDRVIALREKLYGKNSVLMVAPYDNYAELLGQAGDFARALPMAERAQKLAMVMGTAHPMLHQVMNDHAVILIEAGKLDEAKAMLDETLGYEQAAASTVLPQTQEVRARLALVESAWSDARSWAQKSIDSYVAAGGENNPALWRPLTDLAKADVALAKPADAKPLLARAVAIGEKASVPAADLEPTRTALAALH